MSENTFLQRFASVQAELKAPKARTNKFGGYKYRSCEDILKAAKPLLKKHSLVLTMTDTIQEANGRFYVVATAIVSRHRGPAYHPGHRLRPGSRGEKGHGRQPDHRAPPPAMPGSMPSTAVLSGRCHRRRTVPSRRRRTSSLQIIPCADCKYNILPHNDGKRSYTPPQIAAMTKKAFGRELCWKCAEKARDSGKKA